MSKVKQHLGNYMQVWQVAANQAGATLNNSVFTLSSKKMDIIEDASWKKEKKLLERCLMVEIYYSVSLQ